MFFFIGGVQPKTLFLDDRPGICPSCGLLQARMKRVDHYFSLFFIPLFPVKRGEPFLECRKCGIVAGEPDSGPPRTRQDQPGRCPHCSHALEPTFQYCPFCGRRVH
jgi:hypothetical protein